MRKLRPRLTYANVVATMALFAALGGGAYAAKKIHSNQIAANAIKSKQIATGAVKSSELSGTIMAATAPGGGPTGCTLDSQTGGISATSSTGAPTGPTCDVTFPRSVDNCTVQATPLHPGQDISGEAGIHKLGGAVVRVTRRNSENNFQDFGLFAIEAICP